MIDVHTYAFLSPVRCPCLFFALRLCRASGTPMHLCPDRMDPTNPQLMAQARQEGIEPDTTSYNHAMKGMAIQKQWTRARKLLKTMVSEGYYPDVRTYNGLVEAAGMGSPSPRKHMIEVSGASPQLARHASSVFYVSWSALRPCWPLDTHLCCGAVEGGGVHGGSLFTTAPIAVRSSGQAHQRWVLLSQF